MLITELSDSDDDILQLVDCLWIVGTYVFTEEPTKEEVQWTDAIVEWEKNALQHDFQLISAVMETTLQLCQVVFEHNTSD